MHINCLLANEVRGWLHCNLYGDLLKGSQDWSRRGKCYCPIWAERETPVTLCGDRRLPPRFAFCQSTCSRCYCNAARRAGVVTTGSQGRNNILVQFKGEGSRDGS